MGRPKKYTFTEGQEIKEGWIFLREGRAGAGNRYVWTRCPLCTREVEIALGEIIRADRPDKCRKSCGCGLAAWRSQRFRQREPQEAAEHELTKRYRDNARKRHIEFALTGAQCAALFAGDCHYCGCPPDLVAYARSYSARHVLVSGIDRVNNGDGYTPANVVSCCKTCNRMKGTSTRAGFLAKARAIAKLHPLP